MFVVKAGYLKRLLLVNSCSNLEIFKKEILNLRKGDLAENVGSFGKYKKIKIVKTMQIINLTEKEIVVLFKVD